MNRKWKWLIIALVVLAFLLSILLWARLPKKFPLKVAFRKDEQNKQVDLAEYYRDLSSRISASSTFLRPCLEEGTEESCGIDLFGNVESVDVDSSTLTVKADDSSFWQVRLASNESVIVILTEGCSDLFTLCYDNDYLRKGEIKEITRGDRIRVYVTGMVENTLLSNFIYIRKS